MTNLLREPLLHFIVLGAGVFALFALFDDTPPPVADNLLEVSDNTALRLAQQFEATWRRPPTEDELAGLIDGYVREDVLVREAQALGLDRNDAVIRQRLAQKMGFLLEGGAEAEQPTDAMLQEHLDTHSQRFERAPLVAFEQVMVRDGADPEPLRVALRTGEGVEALASPSLLPGGLRVSPPRVVDGTFGAGFFDAVFALTPGEWGGPVQSAYGQHLVRVLEAQPARQPALEEIRDAVVQDWRNATRARLVEERFDALQGQYEIVRPDPAAVLAQ